LFDVKPPFNEPIGLLIGHIIVPAVIERRLDPAPHHRAQREHHLVNLCAGNAWRA
jgi:hypothetical protein